MKHFLITVFLLTTLSMSYAQSNGDFNPGNMLLKWEFSGQQHKNTSAIPSLLTLVNEGKTALPSQGWSIYFNSRSLKVAGADTEIAEIKHVNGDLFRLIPKKGNKALEPGASQQIHLLSDEVKNQSDLPAGCYFVWDSSPEKGFPLKKESITSTIQTDKDVLLLANKIYTQNQLIREIPAEQLPAIFPTPVSYQPGAGQFEISAVVKLSADPAFIGEARSFAKELSGLFGKTISVNAPGKGNTIVFKTDASIAPEGYQLSITPAQVTITASHPAGAFYAIQSLKTMLPPQLWSHQLKSAKIPAAEISDQPRFGFRGVMMDVARNFQPKSEVLKVLDIMALYKLNVFHFHLNDDEGWRLEIPALPELTTVGSQRGHTADDSKNILPSYGSGALTGVNSGSGFYSKADFIEILKYAKERHIRVIPEIETPGHARAAIKAMDARYEKYKKEGNKEEAEKYLLRDVNDKSVYESVQGFNDNVLNPAVPSVYRFLEKVTDEILGMYKEAGAEIQTIHFGGDEVPPGVWTKSEAVNHLISQDPMVKNPDDLWFYYFEKVNGILKARNLYLSGWEEIGLRKTVLDGKHAMILNSDFVKENFHTEVWKNTEGNEDLAYKMANAGYKVTLTCVTNLYFDLAVNTDFDEPGQIWGGYVGVDKPFYFVPYDYYKTSKEDVNGKPIHPSAFKHKERLTDYGKTNIIGIQAPLWSETIKTPERLEYMLVPKIFGIAERAWAKDPSWATEADSLKSEQLYQQAWSEFIHVIGKKELPRIGSYAGGYRYRIPTAGAIVKDGNLEANVQYPGLTIRYTTNGSEPDGKSKAYTQPIPAKGTIKLTVFDADGKSGRTVTLVN